MIRVDSRSPRATPSHNQHRRRTTNNALDDILSASHLATMTDLHSVALDALRNNGFAPDLDASAQRELATLRPAAMTGGLRDLRALLWSSIDNTESKDLDQVEYAEELPGK